MSMIVSALSEICLAQEFADVSWAPTKFSEFLKPNKRPYTLGPEEDADLVGMRLYGGGPFHRELKVADKIRKKSHFVVRTGDVIYNKLFAWKGTFGVVPSEFDGMFVSDKFPTYAHDPEKIDLNFLKWFFRYAPLWDQARAMSTGSAALSKLTLNPPKFLELIIPLPPLCEQRQIVSKLDSLALNISALSELHRTTRDEANVLFGAYLNKLTESYNALGVLSDVLEGKPRNGWSAACDNASDGTAILALSAVTGYEYNATSFKRTSLPTNPDAHYWLKPGDLLITRSNTPELVGHSAIYDGYPERCIYPDLIMRIPVNKDLADIKFVWYWLRTPLVRKYIRENSKGTSPTMKKINQGTVMGIPFPNDIPLKAQRKIISQLDNLRVKITQITELQGQASEEADTLFPAILDRVFRCGAI